MGPTRYIATGTPSGMLNASSRWSKITNAHSRKVHSVIWRRLASVRTAPKPSNQTPKSAVFVIGNYEKVRNQQAPLVDNDLIARNLAGVEKHFQKCPKAASLLQGVRIVQSYWMLDESISHRPVEECGPGRNPRESFPHKLRGHVSFHPIFRLDPSPQATFSHNGDFLATSKLPAVWTRR